MNDNEVPIDDMEYSEWIDSHRLTDADIDELAHRYDTGEIHCDPRPRDNPHDD